MRLAGCNISTHMAATCRLEDSMKDHLGLKGWGFRVLVLNWATRDELSCLELALDGLF